MGDRQGDDDLLEALPDPRTLLHKYDLWPRKSLGQNFLVDPSAPDRIADCADLSSDDTVLEVGAGLGTLTASLAARAARVIAVETDPKLAAVLETELGQVGRIEIVHGDILELDPAAMLGAPLGVDRAGATPAVPSCPLWGPRLPHYHVVANLPYYITGAVVQHLLEASVRPIRMTLTVQLEVAQRMAAQPGEMSLLAVSTQFYGTPRICMRLKRGAFYPVPQVSSAVLRLDLYDEPPVPVDDVAQFFEVVKAGFAQRRKQLRNTLAATLQLDPTDVEAALQRHRIDHHRRAETLAIPEWGQVYAALSP
ncbi:MAG: ribosomal RNA small subunit methyltransferase A, partial [Anaerolineae bacterium]|nr:ribosomal RNA small subunit methyltransferase A [Anaerolineae bacterium]